MPVIEVDLAIECIVEPEQINEMVDLLYRHRHSYRAARTLECTHDSVLRACVHFDKRNIALKILGDPVCCIARGLPNCMKRL